MKMEIKKIFKTDINAPIWPEMNIGLYIAFELACLYDMLSKEQRLNAFNNSVKIFRRSDIDMIDLEALYKLKQQLLKFAGYIILLMIIYGYYLSFISRDLLGFIFLSGAIIYMSIQLPLKTILVNNLYLNKLLKRNFRDENNLVGNILIQQNLQNIEVSINQTIIGSFEETKTNINNPKIENATSAHPVSKKKVFKIKKQYSERVLELLAPYFSDDDYSALKELLINGIAPKSKLVFYGQASQFGDCMLTLHKNQCCVGSNIDLQRWIIATFAYRKAEGSINTFKPKSLEKIMYEESVCQNPLIDIKKDNGELVFISLTKKLNKKDRKIGGKRWGI